MNNTSGERCEETRKFKEALERRTRLPVELWDERLTTVLAERVMIECKIRRENRGKYVDEIAAMLILQGYLDYLGNRKRNEDGDSDAYILKEAFSEGEDATYAMVEEDDEIEAIGRVFASLMEDVDLKY